MEKNIFAVVRWRPELGWFVQNDIDHEPGGVASVEIRPDGALRVNYDFTATQVGTLTLQPDDALLALGFGPAGAGVGLTAADFQLSRNTDVSGCAYFYNGQWLLNYPSALCAGAYGRIEQIETDHIRVHHLPVYPDVLVPSLTRRLGAVGASVGGFDEDFFDIHFDAGEGRREILFRRSGSGIWPAAKGYPNWGSGNFFLSGVMVV